MTALALLTLTVLCQAPPPEAPRPAPAAMSPEREQSLRRQVQRRRVKRARIARSRMFQDTNPIVWGMIVPQPYTFSMPRPYGPVYIPPPDPKDKK